MNRDAEAWADTFTHPRVNEAAHEVLKAIARCIPEGETTTPLIGMGAIAREAHVNRRTVWTWLPVFVEIGAVRVVDGGQGRPARYTLVHVAGADPITAVPLPLRADLQAVRPRPVLPLPLFDEPSSTPIVRSESEELVIRPTAPITSYTSWAARTITRITSYTSWPLQLVSIVRRVVSETITRITRITSTRPIVRTAGEELVIRTCDPCDPPRAIDAVLTTARDVPPLKETTTTTAPPGDPPRPRAVESPPCRWLGTKHAWCVGRFHVPRDFHDEERRKWPRQPGETDADLDEQLFAHYAAVFAAVPETADLRRFKNEFEICRAYLRVQSPEATPKSRAPTRETRPPIPDNDLFARAAEERRQRYGGS
jgi:hypothetical protein